MTYGLEQAGFEVIAGIDIDPTCKDTYEHNTGSMFIERDIHMFSVDDLAELTGIRREDDSLLFVGCSPCQYWTKINTPKEKSGKTKNLLGEFKRFIEWFKPGYVVIENVPGLFRTKEETVLNDFLKFLKKNSYNYDHQVINANNYGVPQHRERYLLIATRISDSIKLPEEEHDKKLTVENFIGVKNGMPRLKDGERNKHDPLHRAMKLSEKNRKRIRMTRKDGGNRLKWAKDPELQINAYRGKNHIFRDVYGRMKWKAPAPTITTKFHSLSNGRFGHPEEHRALSLREGAALQTFPKSYEFKEEGLFTVARHIGNAVPPELARRIGLQILRSWECANISS